MTDRIATLTETIRRATAAGRYTVAYFAVRQLARITEEA